MKMNDSIRKQMNIQITNEHVASMAYLEMASWCAEQDLPGLEEYFYFSAEDEREHMMEFYRYANANGCRSSIGAVPTLRQSFEHVLDILEHNLYLEQQNTIAINQMAKMCHDISDYATLQFLQPFIKEQQDSERSVEDLIVMVKRVGYDAKNLYFLDKQFKKLMQGKDEESPEKE
ncbi:MAG: ferritin [Bacteroidetes bacterium]|nr:ferritin [Bacteroidota bacterium]